MVLFSGRENEEEGVSSYWMALRIGKITGLAKGKR
jgi:hypothetical protein